MPIVDFMLGVARVVGMTMALGFFFGLGFCLAATLVGFIYREDRE